MHQAQPLGVCVDEGQRAAAQRGLTQQLGEGVEAEDGAAGANDDDLNRFHAGEKVIGTTNAYPSPRPLP
jgi:hypothetical protein